jgi:hypothetical protein
MKVGEVDEYYFGGAGGYVAANVSGELDVDDYTNGSHRTEQLFGSGGGNRVSADFGLDLVLGYRFINGLELFSFFQKGFKQIYYGPADHTCQAGLAIGYAFKYKKQRPKPNNTIHK